MSSDAWQEIQAIKSKRNSLREKLEKRKKARKDILDSSLGASKPSLPSNSSFESTEQEKTKCELIEETDLVKSDPVLEKELLKILNEATLQLPVSSTELVASLKTALDRHASHRAVCNLLQKFATQKLVTVKDNVKEGKAIVDVICVEHTKINAMVTEEAVDIAPISKQESSKRKREDSPDVKVAEDEERKKKEKRDPRATDIFVSFHLCRMKFAKIIYFI